MTKNQDRESQQQTHVMRARAMDGVQVRNDGFQVSTGGTQVSMEGYQKGFQQNVTGVKPKEYGRQTTPSVTPQRNFAPANGPKVPPRKP